MCLLTSTVVDYGLTVSCRIGSGSVDRLCQEEGGGRGEGGGGREGGKGEEGRQRGRTQLVL